MARLPYLDVDAAPAAVRDALGLLPPLNIFSMLGHAETLLEPYLRLGATILGDLQLDPRLRELAILQVAHQSEATYEWVQHVAIGRHAGLTDHQISAIADAEVAGHPGFTETERAVLAFTEAVVDSPTVDGATFDELRGRLSSREIVELLVTIGSYLMLARLMTVLEIELDEPVGNTVVDLSHRVPPPSATRRPETDPPVTNTSDGATEA